MTPEAHEAFTRRLVERLVADPDVLGVVGLGSTSGVGAPADEWSDHDVFVITVPGAQERFRSGPWWLPDADRVVLWLRETEHGCAALYVDGHLVELAVFDERELHVARVNRARVLLDRGGVAASVEQVRQATGAQAAPDDAWLVGKLLTTLAVGAGRAHRGEVLSAAALVHGAALDILLELLARHLPPAHPVLDELAPRRRVEQAYPELAPRLHDLLAAPVADAAAGVLDLAEELLASHVAWRVEAAAAVREVLRSRRTPPP